MLAPSRSHPRQEQNTLDHCARPLAPLTKAEPRNARSTINRGGTVGRHGRDRVQTARQVQNTLDPLLEVLTRDYVDDADLTGRLTALFKASRPPCARV